MREVLYQSTAASTWWCGLRSRLGWVEIAVGLPEGPSYPRHSLSFSSPSPSPFLELYQMPPQYPQNTCTTFSSYTYIPLTFFALQTTPLSFLLQAQNLTALNQYLLILESSPALFQRSSWRALTALLCKYCNFKYFPFP